MHLGFDFHRAEFSGATWARRMSSIGRPTRSISSGTPVNSGEEMVPRHQPEIAVHHHDPVAHAGQGRCENRAFVGERFVAAPPDVAFPQQQCRHQQHERVMPPAKIRAFCSQSSAARIASARSTPTTTFRSRSGTMAKA